MYSRRLSLYKFEASTLAGEEVFGSFSRLRIERSIRCALCGFFGSRKYLPLNAGQDGGDVIRRAPPILEDVQTELSGGIDIGMKHGRDEFDAGRFIRILFLEMHGETKGAILKWGVGWADNDGVPGSRQPGRPWSLYRSS